MRKIIHVWKEDVLKELRRDLESGDWLAKKGSDSPRFLGHWNNQTGGDNG